VACEKNPQQTRTPRVARAFRIFRLRTTLAIFASVFDKNVDVTSHRSSGTGGIDVRAPFGRAESHTVVDARSTFATNLFTGVHVLRTFVER